MLALSLGSWDLVLLLVEGFPRGALPSALLAPTLPVAGLLEAREAFGQPRPGSQPQVSVVWRRSRAGPGAGADLFPPDSALSA